MISNSAAALLSWDQTTYMPPGGAVARGRQMATLGQLAHEKFTDAAIGRLLDDLQPYAESLPYDSDDAGLLRVTRHDYERAVKVPPSFTAQFYSHSAASYEAWVKARPENNFAAVLPMLERDAGAEPPVCRFLSRLRTHRRPADRCIGLWHAGRQRAVAVRRAA